MAIRIKLTGDEIRCMALFERVTGASSKDCIIDSEGNKILFVTSEHQAGLAVGRNGSNVKTLRRITGRRIDIIEYADNPVDFIKNVFTPAKIKEVRITPKPDGRKIAVVIVDPVDKGVAIGRGGEKADRARQLVKKYFDIDSIIIN